MCLWHFIQLRLVDHLHRNFFAGEDVTGEFDNSKMTRAQRLLEIVQPGYFSIVNPRPIRKVLMTLLLLNHRPLHHRLVLLKGEEDFVCESERRKFAIKDWKCSRTWPAEIRKKIKPKKISRSEFFYFRVLFSLTQRSESERVSYRRVHDLPTRIQTSIWANIDFIHKNYFAFIAIEIKWTH